MKKTMKFVAVMGAFCALIGSAVAQTETKDCYFTGANKFGGLVDMQGEFKIDGTTLSATAAQLNNAAALADQTGSVGTLTITTATTNLALSSAYSTYIISGVGTAPTNTLVIATPYAAGSVWRIVRNPSVTNSVNIADSGTLMAVGAGGGLLAPTDVITLYAVTTGQMVRVGGSVN